MPPLSSSWIALAATEQLTIFTPAVEEAVNGQFIVKTVDFPYRPLNQEEEGELAQRLQGAGGIVLRAGYLTESLIAQLPDLKIVAVHGAGVDQVDLMACQKRDITVTNAPGANANAVAELTLGLMISVLRQIPESCRLVKTAHAWDDARHTGGELRGRTLGLVGYGQIGRRVGALAAAFGMQILAYDPELTDTQILTEGAAPHTFDSLCEAADIISLHAPAIPTTHHIINETSINTMKPGVIIINCARGPLIDETALARGLHSGKVGGAALDVLGGEPPDPKSPIFTAPNTLITPHMAGSTHECLATIATTTGHDIWRVLNGEPPQHPVTL